MKLYKDQLHLNEIWYLLKLKKKYKDFCKCYTKSLFKMYRHSWSFDNDGNILKKMILTGIQHFDPQFKNFIYNNITLFDNEKENELLMP